LAALVGLVSAPGLFVVARGIVDFSPPWWQHLAQTILPFYAKNTLTVATGATAFALLAGGIPAWLTFRYDYPGRPASVFLQLLPLTIPAYVAAGLFLEASASPFFESRAALALELGAGAAPLVFLFLRIALARLPAALFEAAASLGAGPLEQFRRVGLPLLATPLIAAGCLVMAETMSDFGTATRVGIPTLTVGLYQQWFALQAPGIATMLGLILFVAAACCATPVIRFGLARQRANSAAALQPLSPCPAPPLGAIAIHALCLLAAFPGFLAPLSLAGRWAANNIDHVDIRPLFHDAGTTVSTAVLTVTLCLLLTMAFAALLEPGERASRWDRAVWLAAINFISPSLVMATIWLAAGLTGQTVIVIATAAKLLPLSLLPVADAMGRLPASLVESARALGCTRLAAVRRVVLPQLFPALAGGMLLIYILATAELTFALTLQSFGYGSLALRIYSSASLFLTQNASVWVLCLVLVSLYPVWRLSRFVDAPRGIHALNQ